MKKIYLTDNAKQILLSLNRGEDYTPKDSDENDIILLAQEDLLNPMRCVRRIARVELTDKAKAYLHVNPKLKNPSIWDDKKYIITTAIAIAAIVISIIALFKK